MPTLPALSVQMYSVRRQLAEDLSGTLARLAAIGLQQVEPFDLLTDPAGLLDPRVVLEVDTYWAAVGGQQVPDLVRRLGDRVRLLHLKDGPISKVNTEQLPLGAGAMPVPEIVAATTSLEIPVVEFDDYAGDLFDGIAQSFRYATTLQVNS